MNKPNFIFILIDDLGWRDLGCYGSSFYETPNIDRLASQSVRFTDAYASCPVCSPTRASILTGKYPATVGITEFIGGNNTGKLSKVPYKHSLPLDEKTLATTLRDAGYQTWHVGKWHLGGKGSYPEDHGFDVNIGGSEWGMPSGGYFSPYHNPKIKDGPRGENLTDRLCDEAMGLIKNRRDSPFFLNLWFYAVHIPIQGKRDLVGHYKDKILEMGLDKVETLVEGEKFSFLEKKDKKVVRRIVQSDPGYAAMIQTLDENIGKLLDFLEEEGLSDDTVVIFTSDNGGLSTAESSPTSNRPLAEGKGWMYEGGTRVPLMVRWPSLVKKGTLSSIPVTSTDFYPTLLEMAGLPALPKQHCDGISILPLLEGKEMNRDAIYWHYPHYSNQGGTPGSSVRAGDYKLIEFFEEDDLELYNLKDDLAELKNISLEKPEITKKLHQLLKNWRAQVEAKIPV